MGGLGKIREEWRPVVGWEGFYEVSSHGRVRSVDREVRTSEGRVRRYRSRLLSPGLAGPKRKVGLHAPGCKPQQRKVHHLVLEAFEGPRPAGMEGRHMDGKNLNNCTTNLKWGTPKQNGEDRVRHDTHTPGSRNKMAKLDEATVLRIRHDSRLHELIARDYGVSRPCVSMIKEGSTWRHVGGPTQCRPQKKLTEDDVRAIRKDSRKNIEIAPDYGVAPNTISAIKHGHSWKHVK